MTGSMKDRMAISMIEGAERRGELKPGDLAQLKNLLRENGLPQQDCAEHIAQFIGIFEQTKLIAAGGLENVGVCGLLRSIVVAQNNRSMGLGREITIALLQQA